jgi:hypothetical protein
VNRLRIHAAPDSSVQPKFYVLALQRLTNPSAALLHLVYMRCDKTKKLMPSRYV